MIIVNQKKLFLEIYPDARGGIMHWLTKLTLHYYSCRDDCKCVCTSLHKKRNLAHVGMAQCMNALADKVQKQEVSCTQ